MKCRESWTRDWLTQTQQLTKQLLTLRIFQRLFGSNCMSDNKLFCRLLQEQTTISNIHELQKCSIKFTNRLKKLTFISNVH